MLSKYDRKYEEELVFHRDSKMRRFCNYFVTLYNQRKICPFTQFVSQTDLDSLKDKVTAGLGKESRIAEQLVTQEEPIVN